jgi:hypothetical protein
MAFSHKHLNFRALSSPTFYNKLDDIPGIPQAARLPIEVWALIYNQLDENKQDMLTQRAYDDDVELEAWDTCWDTYDDYTEDYGVSEWWDNEWGRGRYED